MKKIVSLISLMLLTMLLCGSALAGTTKVITMDTSDAPEIPKGTFSAEIVPFAAKKTYDAYKGNQYRQDSLYTDIRFGEVNDKTGNQSKSAGHEGAVLIGSKRRGDRPSGSGASDRKR